MGTTSIEWTNKSWNPIRGCSRVSSGCERCYAEKQAHRFSGKGGAYEGLTRLTKHGPVWTGKIKLVPEVLDQPLRWKKPARIFVNSMSDLFHEDVPDEFIDRVFAVIATAIHRKHAFQVLTKRPDRMLRYFQEPARRDLVYQAAYKFGYGAAMCGGTKAPIPVPNVQLGVSCEDQKTAEERIPLLLQTPAAVRFVSLEPLLGAININPFVRWTGKQSGLPQPLSNALEALKDLPGIDWVIVGGESGPKARPCHPDWIRSLRDQCAAAGVPFFFKQWGEWAPALEKVGEFKPIGKDDALTRFHLWKDEEENVSIKIGKKAAGAIIDGREWRQFPITNP